MLQVQYAINPSCCIFKEPFLGGGIANPDKLDITTFGKYLCLFTILIMYFCYCYYFCYMVSWCWSSLDCWCVFGDDIVGDIVFILSWCYSAITVVYYVIGMLVSVSCFWCCVVGVEICWGCTLWWVWWGSW